jgi:hypothetical protein
VIPESVILNYAELASPARYRKIVDPGSLLELATVGKKK